MYELIGFAVFCLIGFGVWQGLAFLKGIYEERVPDKVQDPIYKTLKDLPKLVWEWGISIVFWSSVGAVLLQLVLTPFGLQSILPPAAWAPLVFMVIVMLMIFNFWDTPHRTKEPPKARGRNLKSSLQSPAVKPAKSSPSQKRGRTIRTYRDVR